MRASFLALGLIAALGAPAFAADAPIDAKATLVSAYRGDAVSQYQLGVMLLTGKGLKQDIDLAGMWFNCAAGQGVVEAQYQLSQLELSGQAPGGKTAAYKWLLLSEGKNSDRIAQRTQLEKELDPNLVTIMHHQAESWKPVITPLTPYVKGKRPACAQQQASDD